MKKNSYRPYQEAVIERADQIPVTDHDVLLKDILVRRKVTILAGPPQTGKGHIEAAVVTRITVGGVHPSWPDKTPNRPGKVLIFSGVEDTPSDTFIPRLRAAGANLQNVFFFTGFRSLGKLTNANFGTHDIDDLVHSITKQYGHGFDLLIIDPVFQAIEGDSTSQNAVTRALNNLAAIAIKLNVAILAVTHVVKSAKGRDPLGRIAGPLAYGTVARSVWVTAHNPNRRTAEFDYVLVSAKYSNTKPPGGWGYSIAEAVAWNEFGAKIGSVIQWGQYFPGRAEEILQQVEQCATKKADAIDKAIDFLKEALKGKSVPYPDILAHATNQGISGGTLVRAKKTLGVISSKETGVKHGRSIWSLPT